MIGFVCVRLQVAPPSSFSSLSLNELKLCHELEDIKALRTLGGAGDGGT